MNGSNAESDEIGLVARVKAGEARAFETLMERYYDRIYGVIGRMVRDAEKARDLTQECFLRAWRSIDTFAGDASFYTWLYRISRNLVISEARKERARPHVSVSLDQGQSDGEEPRMTVADMSAEPARTVDERERRRILLDAIAALSPDFREVIILRDVEAMSYEEIAGMLSIPVGTVRSRLYRARAELMERVANILSL